MLHGAALGWRPLPDRGFCIAQPLALDPTGPGEGSFFNWKTLEVSSRGSFSKKIGWTSLQKFQRFPMLERPNRLLLSWPWLCILRRGIYMHVHITNGALKELQKK